MNGENKGTQPESYGFFGYFLLIIGLAGITALLLFIFKGQLVQHGWYPSFCWAIWGCVFSALLVGLLIMKFWWPLKQRIEQLSFRPQKSGKLKSAPQVPGDNHVISKTKIALRHHYGCFWPRKIRILLVVGSVSDVQRLVPGLSQELWQEDRGTLLLWGGELTSEADTAWLSALRKLRRRPADGIVWVTSAFDNEADTDSAHHENKVTADAMESLAHAFYRLYDVLDWRLPLYVWSLHGQNVDHAGYVTQPVGCLLPADCASEHLSAQLSSLSLPLMTQGVQHICEAPGHTFLLSLADRLLRKPETIAAPLAVFLNAWRPLPLAGVIFSMPSREAARTVRHHWSKDNRWDALPASVMALPAGLRPRKPGINRQQVAAVTGAVALALTGASMLVSFVGNHRLITAAQVLRDKQPLESRLHALSALQKTIIRLQYRSAHGVPWYARAGLSQNDTLLAALLVRYAESAQPLLRDAAALHLQNQLMAFTQLPPDSPLRERMAKPIYDRLKLYLMLARPEKMNAAWFGQRLAEDWPQRKGIKNAFWEAEAPALLTFYGASLASHPHWHFRADEAMVAQARALLIRQMGMRNSESTLYQKMLAQVAKQYADMRLADMTGDTDASRLFTTDNVLPGMFTRQAWEEAVAPAIENIVTARREEIDWVLSDSKKPATQQLSPDALKQRLAARYFADFSGAWLDFLNSLRWQPAATLSDAIDQLTLMADVRQSPLVALMNTLSIQGRTGQASEALSDSLVISAKNLFGQDKQPVIDQGSGAHGPLDATFGPVLALIDEKAQGMGSHELSLQTYITRVTQVRLRLQQVTNATDPQAMTQALAQTVFQGKAIDLTETRDYGSLVAAGFGQEWGGFGQTVFVRPMEQAWQQVLTPAAQSLNAQWRTAVVDDWNSAFGGRYPFRDTSSEVSLPLLAKYLNGDTGRIARFLQTRLNGVLHKEGSHWVADDINAQGLAFNPAFLQAMDTLSHISDVAFTRGEAGLHFDLRPGTAAGIMQTTLVIDSQKLTYMNQMPVWKRFTWPEDTEAPGASLSWVSTQAGTRLYADLSGAWGFIRLLDKAAVSAYPGVNSSWHLAWQAPDGRVLNYTLRTEAGEGPLALLRLRHFTLPDNIFIVSASDATHDDNVGDDEPSL
ncbi:type VI secretion protein VasK [Cronobacter sakazakii]|uniref:ImcF-related family protein n=1 Tax=Cronobacter sakazakii TaxID=28141 RepID=UPI00158829EF|nr:ImcF-related family protein [Cronobacter sakazakii]NUW65623.1 type VI secretion protein VasK [Cronobacter sakazakii]